MGARNVKAVYAAWAQLPGKPFQLLAYMALRTRDSDPRWYGGRDELAAGLGYARLDDAADRAVSRALTVLLDHGALTYAVRPGPGRRAEYRITTSMQHTTQTVAGPSDARRSNGRRKPWGTHDGLLSNARRKPSSVAPAIPSSSTRKKKEEVKDHTGAPPKLRVVAGGGVMPRTRKPAQPGLWPAPVPTPAGDTPSVTTQTILADWIDYCRTERDVQLPKRLIGHYAKTISEALDDGFTPNQIKNALASMLADNVANRPSLLPNRLVAIQTGPERRPAPTRASTTDAAIAKTLALGARLQAQADRKAIGQ